MNKKSIQINADMTISEIMENVPEAADILAQFQLGCAGCMMGGFESLRQGAMVHGMSEEEVEEILAEINHIANTNKPIIEIDSLQFTETAYDKVLEFIRNDANNRQNLGLRIQLNEKNEEKPYFFDLTEKKNKNEKTIQNPSLTIYITEKDHKKFHDLLIDYKKTPYGEGFKITKQE